MSLVALILNTLRRRRTLRSSLRVLHGSAFRLLQSRQRAMVGSALLPYPNLSTKKSSLEGRSERSDLAYPWWYVFTFLPRV